VANNDELGTERLANISRSRYVAISTQPVHRLQIRPIVHNYKCGPMPNMMVTLPNIGGALWSTPQSLADAR